MESSNILTALEELERWRSRKAKLEQRLEELHAKRDSLRARLEEVKKELSAVDNAIFEPRESPTELYRLPPLRGGR